MLKPDPTNFKHIGISTAMSLAKIQKFPRTNFALITSYLDLYYIGFQYID